MISKAHGLSGIRRPFWACQACLQRAEPPLSDICSNFQMILVPGAQALTAFPGHSNDSLSRQGREASHFSGVLGLEGV